MIEYIFASILATIIGVAMVVWFGVMTRNAIRHQRELAARRNEIASQAELEKFIRAVDQATSDEELNRLAEENKKDELCSS